MQFDMHEFELEEDIFQPYLTKIYTVMLYFHKSMILCRDSVRQSQSIINYYEEPCIIGLYEISQNSRQSASKRRQSNQVIG